MNLPVELRMFSQTWLQHFVLKNNYEMCLKTLRKSDIDVPNKIGKTPLHYAAFSGYKDIVHLLLSHKCKVNPKDMMGLTPLDWAVYKGHSEIVSMLLAHNATVSFHSILSIISIEKAKKDGQVDMFKELLVAANMQSQNSEVKNEDIALPHQNSSQSATGLRTVTDDCSCSSEHTLNISLLVEVSFSVDSEDENLQNEDMEINSGDDLLKEILNDYCDTQASPSEEKFDVSNFFKLT